MVLLSSPSSNVGSLRILKFTGLVIDLNFSLIGEVPPGDAWTIGPGILTCWLLALQLSLLPPSSFWALGSSSGVVGVVGGGASSCSFSGDTSCSFIGGGSLLVLQLFLFLLAPPGSVVCGEISGVDDVEMGSSSSFWSLVSAAGCASFCCCCCCSPSSFHLLQVIYCLRLGCLSLLFLAGLSFSVLSTFLFFAGLVVTSLLSLLSSSSAWFLWLSSLSFLLFFSG